MEQTTSKLKRNRAYAGQSNEHVEEVTGFSTNGQNCAKLCADCHGDVKGGDCVVVNALTGIHVVACDTGKQSVSLIRVGDGKVVSERFYIENIDPTLTKSCWVVPRSKSCPLIDCVVWDILDDKILLVINSVTLEANQSMLKTSFNGDGTLLCVMSQWPVMEDGRLNWRTAPNITNITKMFDIATGNLMWSLEMPTSALCCKLSFDDSWLLYTVRRVDEYARLPPDFHDAFGLVVVRIDLSSPQPSQPLRTEKRVSSFTSTKDYAFVVHPMEPLVAFEANQSITDRVQLCHR